jgi:peptidoglycan/xylan/chitin deacetylase (PgdA/CDA1 family)
MLLALNYHRIGRVPRTGDIWELTVSPENFSSHLATLKNNFQIADPRTHCLVELAISKTLHIVVTFDDGYADNLYAALPLLEMHQVPAIIFLASGYIGKPYFWWDAVEAMFYPRGPHINRLQLIWSSLLRQTPAQREAEVVELLHLSGNPPIDFRPLTLEELKDLAKSNLISFGGHTKHHSWLPYLCIEEVKRDVGDGRNENESMTNCPQVAFAYPFGAMDESITKVVGCCGFSVAFTTEPPNDRWSGDFLAHPRVPMRNWCEGELREKLRKYSSLMAHAQ